MWTAYRVQGYFAAGCLTDLWSTQAKVEDIVLGTGWRWSSDSSVLKVPLGEPGHALFCIGFPSSLGSADDDLMFYPHFSGYLNLERGDIKE